MLSVISNFYGSRKPEGYELLKAKPKHVMGLYISMK